VSQETDLVCVHVCQGLDLAHIYKSKLEAMGIPVLLEYESAGPVIGITVDGLGAVRVMVPVGFEQEARGFLQEDQPSNAENEPPSPRLT
jgi:hypothetical protein